MISRLGQRVVVETPSGEVEIGGMILGFSADSGETWVFVDMITVGEDKFRQMFPDLADEFAANPRMRPQ